MQNSIDCWKKPGKAFSALLNKTIGFVARVLIRAYQYTLSPLLRAGCRFEPSCSNYALDAFKKHDSFTASWLTAKRLCKCHPFGGQGYDPVPEKG